MVGVFASTARRVVSPGAYPTTLGLIMASAARGKPNSGTTRGKVPSTAGHPPSVVFEVLLHEKKLGDSCPVPLLQTVADAAAGEGNNGLRGEHPPFQERHNAG